MRPIVKALHKEHAGSRKDRLKRGYVHRDWWSTEHPFFAGDEYVFDDLTGNVYFWIEDEHGAWQLLLGQFIAGCDARSLRIYPGAVVPSNVYHQLACRTAMNGMVQQLGIPKRFRLENGIWKTGQLIKGQSINSKKFLASDLPEFKSALSNLGIEIHHTEPGNPRGKIIERVFGLIQPKLERLKGYAGRLQMLDMPETTRRAVKEVNARRAHPSKYFLSFQQMLAEYQNICEEYNAERQEGKILRGMSPNQAWVQLQNPDEPMSRLAPELRYLFAHERFSVPVKRDEFKLPISGEYFYQMEEIWKLNGERVLAWFDPMRPESVIVTDLDGENPTVAERVVKAPAWTDGRNEKLATARQKLSAINRHRRAALVDLKTELSIPYRGHVADEETVAKVRQGEEFNRLREQSAGKVKKRRKINGHRASIGLPPVDTDRVTDEQEEAAARLARAMDEHRRRKEIDQP
ncbi:hypothetical protein GC207_03580 [bacterium]|nr:hypothetical protein [bacterium]